jgi:nucleotide-binding universal stress UspA family protein
VITAARRIAIKDAARVDFLHVWQDPWVALPYSAPFGEVGMPSLIVSTPEQRATLVNNLSAELHDFVSETAEGIQSAEVLREAISYGEGIVDYAKEVTADLIIIGHKGHSKLHDILLGSTPERLLTKSPCSILLVKPPAQA